MQISLKMIVISILTTLLLTPIARAQFFSNLTPKLASSTKSTSNHRAARSVVAPALGLKLSTSTVFLLNSSGQTCTSSSVSPLRISFGQIKLEWKSSAPLDAGSLVAAFENANFRGGEYICVISGKEFDAVFGTLGSAVAGDVTSVAGCNAQCGGVELLDSAVAFSSQGTVSVFGTTQIGSATHVQQHASVPVTVEFVP